MTQVWVARIIFESQPEGRRKTVRSRDRWLEDLDYDLRSTKVKRWRQKANIMEK
jgi:hypothetical protein